MLKKDTTYEMTILFTPGADILELQVDKAIAKALKEINVTLEDTGVAAELPDD